MHKDYLKKYTGYFQARCRTDDGRAWAENKDVKLHKIPYNVTSITDIDVLLHYAKSFYNTTLSVNEVNVLILYEILQGLKRLLQCVFTPHAC